jgi:hypothetical protein
MAPLENPSVGRISAMSMKGHTTRRLQVMEKISLEHKDLDWNGGIILAFEE